jgi:hypothetical protein
MSIRDLYPNATEPTEPRFKVGDMVHTSGVVRVRNTWFGMNDAEAISAMVLRVNAEPSEVVVYPAVFGVVVEYQEAGTEVYEGMPQGEVTTTWRGWEHDYSESELDLPDSGSIWFLPDNERRYFVRWANKRPYQYGSPPSEFSPQTSATGGAVFNLSLYSECDLNKCPDFVGKLRRRACERKMVESVLQERLGLDDCSTTGITSIVCGY